VVDGFNVTVDNALSRRQLIDWVNSEFALNLTKIEECGTGAVYCLIIDKMLWRYQRILNKRLNHIYKVRWDTINKYDFVENFKILQSLFKDFNIQKNIDVEGLSQMKMQDNLLFLQWLYCLYIKYNNDDNEPDQANNYPGTLERRLFNNRQKYLPWNNPANYTNVDKQNSYVPNTTQENNFSFSHNSYDKGSYKNSSVNNQEVLVLRKKIEELEKQLYMADKDVANMNMERAEYYVKLLRLDKLWRVRADAGQLIEPKEIDNCFNNILPHDIMIYQEEFEREYKSVFSLVDDVTNTEENIHAIN